MPISRFVSHVETDSNDTAVPHCRRECHAFLPSPTLTDHTANQRTPDPVVVNTLKDDPAGSVSSGSGGGGSAAGGTGGGGTGTNGRAACADADDYSAPGVSPRNGGVSAIGEAVDEVAPIGSPRNEVCDDEGYHSFLMPSPSSSGEDWLGNGTGGGEARTNPQSEGQADHYGGSAGDASPDLDNIVPPPGIPEMPTRVPKKGSVDEDGSGNLPRGAGGCVSVGTGMCGVEERDRRPYSEAAASNRGLVAADQPRGNAAGDGNDLATRPPAGRNGGGSPGGSNGHMDGKPPAGGRLATENDGKPAVGEAGRTRVGGRDDLEALVGDDKDVAPPSSSDADDEDESMCAPVVRKLPNGDDPAGGVSNGGSGGGSASGGTGGGGTGTNGSRLSSYDNEMFAPTAVASIGWVLTALHVVLLQGLALQANRATLEAGAGLTSLWG